MSVILYDLVGREDRRFSPNCWRTRMALAHKGLDCTATPTRFSDIKGICGGGQRSVPVIDDGGQIIADSWAIAQYLESQYPDAPSLFGPEGEALTGFFQHWIHTAVFPALIPLIILDIHDHLQPEDQGYFRESREKRFNRTLEILQAEGETRLPEFRQTLEPARRSLKERPFLGGENPRYVDYLLFGVLQWSRVISPLVLLEADDPLLPWLRRCLDLYNGLGRQTPAYPWPGL